MQKTLLLAVILVGAALAGCANNGGTPNTNTTTTPTASTPTTTTPAPTPTTPTNESPGEEMPEPDPRCLAPPPASLANLTQTNASTRLGMPELRFTTSDPSDADPCFRFHGPQNATSGWNVFTLAYPEGGRTFHIMPMYFIGNHTMDDVMQAFASDSEPEWAEPAGAVGGVTPGSNGSVAIDLQVGNYMYFCPIEGHMFQGMMGMLAVTQAATEAAAPVNETDATISLVDYNFTVPELHDGMDVIRVTNNGSEPHEAPLVKLAGGANMTTFLAVLEDPNATAPPPGQLIGGVNAIAPGHTVYLLLDLEADQDYGMVCFVSSPEHDDMPHAFIGPMVVDFTVEHADGDAH